MKIICEYLEKHTDVGRSIEKCHIEKAIEVSPLRSINVLINQSITNVSLFSGLYPIRNR